MVSLWLSNRFRPIFLYERVNVLVPATGTTKNLSRSWKRSPSSSRMVHSPSPHCEPKSETATCAPRKLLAACSSRLPPYVRFLSCAHG